MKTKKTLGALALGLALATGATGCGATYTFEATPQGVDEDEAERGLPEEELESIECFTIEADSSAGDDGDEQLGTFCKTSDEDGGEAEEDD